VVPASVHPEYRQILTTYFGNLNVEVVTVPTPDGRLELERLEGEFDDRNTACVLIQHPNFFGCLETCRRSPMPHRKAGALVVQSFDPISLGILKRPGDLGVDVAVAEGQSLGNPMLTADPTWGSWPAVKNSCAVCRGASPGKRSTAAASAASFSTCKPASSTFAAKRRPATSAPTRGSAR
jgi:glycine cleavage system pyridoxal-binding protein P